MLQINTISITIQEQRMYTYHNKLNLPQVRTTHYGLQSIKYKSAKAWNEIKTKISDKLNIGWALLHFRTPP